MGHNWVRCGTVASWLYLARGWRFEIAGNLFLYFADALGRDNPPGTPMVQLHQYVAAK